MTEYTVTILQKFLYNRQNPGYQQDNSVYVGHDFSKEPLYSSHVKDLLYFDTSVYRLVFIEIL
jgi:hypothetical protein